MKLWFAFRPLDGVLSIKRRNNLKKKNICFDVLKKRQILPENSFY